jgi:hypothetical protein
MTADDRGTVGCVEWWHDTILEHPRPRFEDAADTSWRAERRGTPARL